MPFGERKDSQGGDLWITRRSSGHDGAVLPAWGRPPTLCGGSGRVVAVRSTAQVDRGRWHSGFVTPELTLSVLPMRLAVAQLPVDAPFPALAGSFVSLTRTEEEISLVCEEAALPPGVRHEGDWRAMKLHGPFEFSLVGILASVLDPLRTAGVGIFAISTFDTDYVLVKDDQLGTAVDALAGAGHRILETTEPGGPA